MDLGCYGDDFHELMEEYAKKFNVDMESYRWYFYTEEEGSSSIGGIFFKAPNETVERISVTPEMLLEFANKKKWGIEYPTHTVPRKRYDLLINIIVFVVVITFVICSILN